LLLRETIDNLCRPSKLDHCRIRDIRNQFAHASEQIDFSDAEIASWCNDLHHYVKFKGEKAREQFMRAVAAVEVKLDFLIVNSEPRSAASMAFSN
jgi:hypothetical protein